MLIHIRSQPKLRSVKDSHIVETSRTKLDSDNEEECPQPIKKVIKPDFNLLLDSFEDDDDDDSSGTLSPKSRRSSVASPSPEKEVPQWRRTVVRDAVTQERPNNMLQRRNTITVCESPQKWNHPIECLSLTLEEVIHIRNVLTKAELETLITQPELYNSVSKGKVCFTCKKVELSIIDWWRNKCKICKRLVCNNCLRKMNIPKDQFNNIPVHTLCPIPLGQEARDILKVYESTGSVPHSPKTQKKLLLEMENKSPKKKGLQRSQTFNSGSNLATPLPNKNLLKGPQMNVCCECKGMIMDIIRTSRTSIAIVHKGQAVTPPERNSLSVSASSLSQSVRNLFTSK